MLLNAHTENHAPLSTVSDNRMSSCMDSLDRGLLIYTAPRFEEWPPHLRLCRSRSSLGVLRRWGIFSGTNNKVSRAHYAYLTYQQRGSSSPAVLPCVIVQRFQLQIISWSGPALLQSTGRIPSSHAMTAPKASDVVLSHSSCRWYLQALRLLKRVR